MSKTLTQNLAVTFDSSQDARLDFFFQSIEESDLNRTTVLLEKSWHQSPLDTMKLVFNCRDIRNGKAIRSQFLICCTWIYEKKFDSLMLNLSNFQHFGCYKDYLNLLMIALFDIVPFDGTNHKEKEKFSIISPYDKVILKSLSEEERYEVYMAKTVYNQVSENPTKKKDSIPTIYDQNKINNLNNKTKFLITSKAQKKKFFFKIKTNKAKSKIMKKFRLKFFEQKYKTDKKFQILYDKIVEIFAKQLSQDFKNFKNDNREISLAAKWIPNPGRFFDKFLFILTPICKKFFEFNIELLQSIEGLSNESKHLFRYFKKIIHDLRNQVIKIPEIKMSANDWDQIEYNNVPSVAMLRYRNSFIRHDQERYKIFVESKGLKGGALTPAELIKQLVEEIFKEQHLFCEKPIDLDDEKKLKIESIQNQWNSLVEVLKKKGSLSYKNTLAVCDISGSMFNSSNKILPVYGSIGLTLFLLDLSDSAWNNSFVTFSEEPELLTLKANQTLFERLVEIKDSPKGLNTDLNAVFTLILRKGQERELTQEQMPKVLFIFTDMEFDCVEGEKTNYEKCQEQYAKVGYKLPLVIFWNLNGAKSNHSTPVLSKQEGVLLLSGFSAHTFSFLFDSEPEKFSPLNLLHRVINDPIYNCVMVSENEV